MPRNDALVLRFDDLLDETGVGPESVQLMVADQAQAGDDRFTVR